MKKIFTLTLLIIGHQLVAQSPQSIATQFLGGVAGGAGKTTTTQISYTIGQLGAGTKTNAATTVIQGFQQPYVDQSNQIDTTNLLRFAIGEISPQSVWQQNQLQFYVYSKKLAKQAALSIKVSTPQKGPVRFDSNTGYFSFQPGAEDKAPFSVTFYAKLNSQVDSQVVAFNINPALPPENNAFGIATGQTPPQANSSDYLIISDIIDSTFFFNQYIHKTRSVSISGMDVIFENKPDNQLWFFNNNDAIREMSIYGDRVIIRDALSLPQTQVTIYARELIFEDNQGTSYAYINTTPKQATGSQQDQTPGTNGGKAGKITLYIQDFKSDFRFRFIQIGGDGQNATGIGVKSGNAGDGGDFESTLNLQAYSDRTGGVAGKLLDPRAVVGDIYRGKTGNFTKLNNTINWLHPNYLKVVKKFGNKAYFLGYPQLTQGLFNPYIQLIQEYTQTSEWKTLSDVIKLELSQVADEMYQSIYKIESGLDYYGNPAGWVPQLSFEANATAYDNEVKYAMEVFYLQYWISNAGRTIEQRIAAMQSTRAQIRNQLSSDSLNFNGYVAQVQNWNEDYKANESSLNKLYQDLAAVENELIDRAQHNVDEARAKEEKNKWKKTLSTVGTVMSVIPVPAVAAAGVVITTGLAVSEEIDKADFKSLDGTVEGVLEISSTIKKSYDQLEALQGSSKAFADSVNKINFSQLEFNLDKVQTFVGQVKNAAKPLDKNFQLLKEVFNKQQAISDVTVQSELSRLRATEPRLAQINDGISDLHQRQQKLQQDIKSGSESIQRFGNQITQGLLTTDALNKQIGDGSRVLDHRALLYLDEMKKQAEDRLEKYNYYMVKAWEYRMLQPYPSNIDIKPIFDKAKALANAANSEATLSSDDFKSLKTLYDQQLQDVANLILTKYNESGVHSSTAPVRFSLTKTQLATLNKGGVVKINMIDMGLFQPDEEDLRIVNLGINYIKVTPKGGTLGGTAQVDVNIDYPNYSRLKKDGRIYLFNNYTNTLNSLNPIRWGTRLDVISPTPTGDAIVPSAASESLLRYLLSLGGNATSDKILLYSQPAVWADLTISKRDLNVGGRARLDIDSLRLELKYDFTPKKSGLSNVDLAVSPSWMKPYIQVNRIDKFGKQDGRGQLFRSYDANGTVSIKAPKQNGKYRFKSWEVIKETNTGVYSINDSTITLNLRNSVSPSSDKSAAYQIKANYELQEPVLSVPDTIVVGASGGNNTVQVRNTGNVKMDWVADPSKITWLSYTNATNGRVVGSTLPKTTPGLVSFNYQANPNATKRSGYLVLYAPDATDYRDTVYIVQAPTTQAGTIRLNSGGPALNTSLGSFSADAYFTGTSAVNTSNVAIANTTDDALYQVYRRGTISGGSFGYNIPIGNGNYTVKLHFAEVFFTDSGKRVFNVSAEGAPWLTNYDVVADVGPKAAVVKTRNVTVSDGNLTLNLTSLTNFAMVAAIEVLPASTPPSTVRLNSGGGDLNTSLGSFSADASFTGLSAVNTSNVPIANTTDDALYQNYRRGTVAGGSFGYSIPVTNGNYTVKLHFAEVFFIDPGKRVFNVSAEGGTWLTNYDVVADVGPKAAVVKTKNITVSDGNLTLNFASLINFAMVAAIEVSPVSNTPSTIRLNSGGGALNTSLGSFSADASFTELSRVDLSNADVTNTTDDALYQVYRRGTVTGGSFGYNIPVANGTYTVKLHFAEVYFTTIGKRLFNVIAEGAAWLTNYDVVADVGPKVAVVKTRKVTVGDGSLSLNFTSLTNFAMVSAIEVIPAGATRETVALDEGSTQRETILEALPNPFSEKVTFRFSLPTQQRAVLEVYNLQGQQVKRLFDAEVQADKFYEVEWHAEGHPMGMYLIHLSSPQGNRYQKVLLQR